MDAAYYTAKDFGTYWDGVAGAVTIYYLEELINYGWTKFKEWIFE